MGPERLTTEELLQLLMWTIERVADTDSFNGSISYEMSPDADVWEVTGVIKHGNREHGQGFARVIGVYEESGESGSED